MRRTDPRLPRCLEIAQTAGAFALMRRIDEVRAEDGRCHTAALIESAADAERTVDLLDALVALDLVDTDLCSCCAHATAHHVTTRGRAYLAYAGSEAGRALLLEET